MPNLQANKHTAHLQGSPLHTTANDSRSCASAQPPKVATPQAPRHVAYRGCYAKRSTYFNSRFLYLPFVQAVAICLPETKQNIRSTCAADM
jgi:hypothetical protein